MVVAVSLLENVVYDSRGCYSRLDDMEPVWIVDVARYGGRVTALESDPNQEAHCEKRSKRHQPQPVQSLRPALAREQSFSRSTPKAGGEEGPN